jgi:hypothetical protein
MAELLSDSNQLFSMTEDQLLARLGTDLTGPQALPLRPSEVIERGKRWLAAQRDYLEDNICRNESVKQFTLANTDDVAIAMEVAKLLVGLILPVDSATLAVLLVKRGIKGFCSTRWGVE